MFRSTGIRDLSTRDSLLVEDDTITVGNADIDNLVGDVALSGDLKISGTLTVEKMDVNELIATQRFPFDFIQTAHLTTKVYSGDKKDKRQNN